MKKMTMHKNKKLLKLFSRKEMGVVATLLVLIMVASFVQFTVQAASSVPPSGGGGDVDAGNFPGDVQASIPDTSQQVAVTATAASGGSATGRRFFSTNITTTLWYAWNRGLLPSSDSSTNGWATAMSDPNITIGYDFNVYDAANPTQIIQPGSSVAPGQQLLLKFNPYSSNNIYWFATGYSMDSPYGEWTSGATPPARSGNRVSCLSKDLTARYTLNQGSYGMNFDVYIPFVVNPPARTLSNTGGLVCSSLTQNPDGSASAVCTVTAATGSINPSFNYGSTFGKFYYRYYDYRDMSSIGWGGAGCYGNNIPLTDTFGQASSPLANTDPKIKPAYVANFPAQSFQYALTVAPPSNTAPLAPTLSCPASVVVNSDVAVTLTSTDAQANQVQYGMDWIDDGTLQVNSGWSAFVPSGTAVTLTKSGGYSVPGTYTLYGWAQDTLGATSAPASCAVTVTAAPPDLTPIGLTPSTVVAGQSSTFTATLSNTGGSVTPNFSSTVYVCATGDSSCLGNSFAHNGNWLDRVLAFIKAKVARAATSIKVTLTGSPIPAASTGTQSGSNTFGSAGSYQMRLCADLPGNQVPESDENNNCGNWQLLVVCPAGNTVDASGNCVAPQPPTCNISATPSNSAPSTISWSSANATSCTGTGFSTGNATTGTAGVNTLGSYVLSCTGAGGSCTSSTAVSCGTPTPTITASPNRVQPNQTSVITYGAGSVDATCTITGPGAPGVVTANTCSVAPASFTTPPITTQSVYTITCGSVTQTATVNVVPKFVEF